MPLLEQVLKQYPTEVKLVYKNFPLRNHKFGKPAALAAMAAGRQGKFWEMHDKIFANYNKLTNDIFKKFAKEIGLNEPMFEQDLADPDLQKRVQADLQNGYEVGVRGTPTVFVNGRKLKARSLAGFKALIDSELK